jgi:hypothetical protein
VDGSGFVYVADSSGQDIQKFSPDGDFVARFGEFGSNPGQLNYPLGICADGDGTVYVAEGNNDRVQVFGQVDFTEGLTKAIIVAGGGPYDGNNIWNATQMCANFAYRTLTIQGLTKDTIYYLTSDTQLDLDNNGVADDVDADATSANLQQAIEGWASDADSVVLYLVDHGGDGTFRINPTETLSAFDLDTWLDTLQQTISGEMVVIYDACESGSFMSQLTADSGKTRIVITSTSPGESAYFVTQGSVSFSNFFWTHIFNGSNISEAFSLAQEAIGHSASEQTPLLDDNGNGVGNDTTDGLLAQNTYIGNGTVISGDAPTVGSVSAHQNIIDTSSAPLFADSVADADGIARVWAVIRPPDYNQGSTETPIDDLPSFDLSPLGSERYEGTYTSFNSPGTYYIALYARDRIGNTSTPQLTTVAVDDPLSRRAIVVAGGSETDALWPAVRLNATTAYEALTSQGYSDDDIYFMSPATISQGVDGLASLSNLEYAVTTWAASNTRDLVIYLVGNGDQDLFEISDTETLEPYQLDSWLDDLQEQIPGKVVLIYDASCSGSFVSSLAPPEGKERIVVTSTQPNESAYFILEGILSFSNFFWSQVATGSSVRDSFVHAAQAIQGATPQLDDNGNGVGNETGQDGRLARNYRLGVGIMFASDNPVIGSACPDQTLNGEPGATIWVEGLTTTGQVDRVWAVITPPGYNSNQASDAITDLPSIELTHVGNGRYEGIYPGFTSEGDYAVAVYAMDTDGNISLPQETTISQTVEAGEPECGYLVTSDLWIRAVIETEETGPIEGVWRRGGEDTTSAGDQVIWGHFYADPGDVAWGSENNPDLLVKIWFDHGGRLDVNFFHVSVPDIEVYSDYPYDGAVDQQGTTSTTTRYIRQFYENGLSDSEENFEDGTPPAGYSPAGSPLAYAIINDLRIGAVINTEEMGPLEAVWQLGGTDTTAAGDQVAWGHFYASPDYVSWGSAANPDLFVKVWFDNSGRIDVNFFHVSVPDIEVYSDHPGDGSYDQAGTTMMSNRYIRQEYQR